MMTLLENARVLTPDGWIDRGHALIEDGRITHAGRGVAESLLAERVDLTGLTLVPGFIDLHVHGGGGYALAAENSEEVRSYARWVARHGVTGFLATVFAETPAESLRVLEGLREVGEIEDGARLLGVNLEGPFVNPRRRGALPEGWVTQPDESLFRDLLRAAGGKLRLLTIAPELPGASRVMRAALDAGVRVSVGHTDATYQEALAAFKNGASHVTHAFNAMRPFHHRDPGPVAAALESGRVTVEVIADGAHLHPATVSMVISAFGLDRVALVTDGVTPAGLSEGVFRIGGQEARLDSGRITLPDGTIAGGAATMDVVVRNLVDWGLADLAAAVYMASAVPARVLGLGARKGAIEAGYDADMVALDTRGRIAMTWAGGREVFAIRDG